MGTWMGKPKKFTVEVTGPPNWDESWGEVEFRWEYNTTSNCLNIFSEHPDMNDPRQKEPKRYSKSWGEAYLYTIAAWYATYEGKDKLQNLLKDLLEEKD